MLLEKNFRAPVRVSIAHLDPALYDCLERGDQFVIYTRGIRDGTTENPRSHSMEARALIGNLELRALTYELVDVGCHRLVWEIMHAQDIARTNAAE